MTIDWKAILPKPVVKDPPLVKPLAAVPVRPVKKQEPVLTPEDVKRYLSISARAREEKKRG